MAVKGMSVFTHQGEDYTINDPNNAPEFDATLANEKGEYVYYQGDLYRFTAAHTANTAWSSRSKTKVKLGDELLNAIKKLPYSYSELEMTSYANIYQIPFACATTNGATHSFSDIPDGVEGAAIIHIPYQGSIAGYYVDIVVPYNPNNYRGKTYFRVSSSSGALFDWAELQDIETIKNLIPYSYGEGSSSRVYEYQNIYSIPFSCVTVHGSVHSFSDVPINVTGAAVIHVPYQGVTNGYYVDMVIPYNPSNTRGLFFFRISSSSGALFDWTELSGRGAATKRYVAFGDSITRGYRGTKDGQNMGVTTKPYPIAIGEKLNLITTNEGVDGTGWTIDNNHTGATGYEKVMAYDLSGYDFVTIAFGINDYLSSTATIETIESKIRDVIEHILGTYPKITLVLITPLFSAARGSSPEFSFSANGAGGYTLQQITDLIIEICEEYRIGVVDQSKISMVGHLNYEVLLNDLLHPSEDGYLKYGCVLSAEVSKYYMP